MKRKTTDNKDESSIIKEIKKIGEYILAAIGLLTTMATFSKFWEGDQELMTIIAGGTGLFIWVFTLAWIGFKNNKPNKKKGKRVENKTLGYNKRQKIARLLLFLTLIAVVTGGVFIYKQREEMAKKLVVVITAFDGPEQEYGLQNQIVEELNSSLEGFNDIVIVSENEIITPTQGGEHARQTGKRHQADIVIWGWYRPTENPNITLHIENLSPRILVTIDESVTQKTQATLFGLESFSVQQQIGQEMTDLITFFSGLFQFSSGNYEIALSRFNQVLDKPNQEISFHESQRDIIFYHATTLLVLNQQPDKAISEYDLIINENPNNADAINNRGLAYNLIGNTEQAIKDFDRAIHLDPDGFDIFNSRGIAYHKIGELDKAIADFNRSIEINPNYINAYGNRGNVYFDMERYEEALHDYNQLIKIDPKDKLVYSRRGRTYYRLGDYKKAIEDYSKAIKLNPQFSEAYNNRGMAYTQVGKTTEAINDFKHAIELFPEYTLAYKNLGGVYYYLQNYETAINYYSQAIKIDPKDGEAFYNRGYTYFAQGQYKLAITDFSQSIQINPQFPDAYLNRANAYKKLGQDKAAEIDYQKYNELINSP